MLSGSPSTYQCGLGHKGPGCSGIMCIHLPCSRGLAAFVQPAGPASRPSQPVLSPVPCTHYSHRQSRTMDGAEVQQLGRGLANSKTCLLSRHKGPTLLSYTCSLAPLQIPCTELAPRAPLRESLACTTEHGCEKFSLQIDNLSSLFLPGLP